ncbi:MAG: LdpA C-terminal domain-containing domain [Cyanobacteria bacterium J06638_6]
MDIDVAFRAGCEGQPESDIAIDPSAAPHRSLQQGRWVKLICGASYQDMPAVRRLVMLYALAGVDCVDVAADGAVIAAARRGLADAARLAATLGDCPTLPWGRLRQFPQVWPWLMVSLNDSEDPHFRKAHFEAAHCPSDCDRPCVSVCPTAAIQFQGPGLGGVAAELCYGCGRCMDVCPVGHIDARSYLVNPGAFSAEQLVQIDAVEIHTQTGHQEEFAQLWQRLRPWQSHLKLVSISCPDHDQVVPYLRNLYDLMAPLSVPLIWQTDGRPMSGDLGKGTTHAAIRLAQKVLESGLPGYVQLAGGTNGYTVDKLLELGLLKRKSLVPRSDGDGQTGEIAGCHGAPAEAASTPATIAGIAYGSYARSQILPLFDHLEQELERWLDHSFCGRADRNPTTVLSSSAPEGPWPELEHSALSHSLTRAQKLVGQLKSHRHS